MIYSLKEPINRFCELAEVALKEAFYGKKLHLGILAINQGAAGASYIKGKLSMASKLNVDTTLVSLTSPTFGEALKALETLSKSCNGVIVQLPAFENKDWDDKLLLSLEPSLDVDALTDTSLVETQRNPKEAIWPCTVTGIGEFMKWYIPQLKMRTKGKTALILGRGPLVGEPMTRYLRDVWDMTVINCHSQSDAAEVSLYADIATVCVYAANTYGFTYPRNNSGIIFDCGIFKDEEGYLFGCLDYPPDNETPENSYATPVPGGVGKLTVIGLFMNLAKLCGIDFCINSAYNKDS